MDLAEFQDDQKQYLQGFVSGAELARAARGLATFGATLAQGMPPARPRASRRRPSPPGPDAIHHAAQDRTTSEGKTLTPQEQAKRKAHPLDRWGDLVRHAEQGK